MSMHLTNVEINDKQSTNDSQIKLNSLHDGSEGTIYDLLKLPDLDAKGKNGK